MRNIKIVAFLCIFLLALVFSEKSVGGMCIHRSDVSNSGYCYPDPEGEGGTFCATGPANTCDGTMVIIPVIQ